MSYARESKIAKKAMAYDLIQLLNTEKNRDRTYTAEEVSTLIKNYITASTSNS